MRRSWREFGWQNRVLLHDPNLLPRQEPAARAREPYTSRSICRSVAAIWCSSAARAGGDLALRSQMICKSLTETLQSRGVDPADHAGDFSRIGRIQVAQPNHRGVMNSAS